MTCTTRSTTNLRLSSRIGRHRAVCMKSPFELRELGLYKVHSAASGRCFPVKITAASAQIMMSVGGKGEVPQVGSVLLAQALRVTGLDPRDCWMPRAYGVHPGQCLTRGRSSLT